MSDGQATKGPTPTAAKKKAKEVKAPQDGIYWMIRSPWQDFPYTLSRQRQGAWSMFRFAIHDDVPKAKREGFKAVKISVKYKVL